MLLVSALLVGSARISSAAAEAFVVESARSSVAFEVRHLASFVVGTFSRFEGEFTLDRERLERSTATFAIEVASLATDDPRRTARLGREDFFATEQFPTIRFRSTGWRLAEAATYEITGDLTIKGVSKSVAVRVQLPGKSSRWQATARLDRRDFGVTGGPPGLIGNKIEIRIELAVRPAPAESTAASPVASATTARAALAVRTMVEPDEPGERLRLSGAVYDSDGQTPVPAAKLYVFHTDASGKYSDPESGVDDERNPRLKCRLETDAQGRFEIQTIFPGPYPGGKTPRHIHIMVTTPRGVEQNATFQFTGDPNLTPDDYRRFGSDGTFSAIRPAERGPDGALLCVKDIRLRARP